MRHVRVIAPERLWGQQHCHKASARTCSEKQAAEKARQSAGQSAGQRPVGQSAGHRPAAIQQGLAVKSQA